MAVTVEVSEMIDRPVADVWHFFAEDHVRNHPRWDPQMQLEQVTEGPIGVGTVIRRQNMHSGTPVEGTIEVVEFAPPRTFATVIHDGSVETRSRVTFEAAGQDRTILTMSAVFPAMDESKMDVGRLRSLMQRSAQSIKQLVESEV